MEKKEFDLVNALVRGEKIYQPFKNRETGEVFYRRFTPWSLLQGRGSEYESCTLETFETEEDESWIDFDPKEDFSSVPEDGVDSRDFETD